MINKCNRRKLSFNVFTWSIWASFCLIVNLSFTQTHQIEIPFEYSNKNTQTFRSDFYEKPAGSGSYQLEIRLSPLKQVLKKADGLVFQFSSPQELEIQIKLLQSLGSSMAFIDEKNILVDVGYGFELTRVNRGILVAHEPKNPLSIGIYPIGLTGEACRAKMEIDFHVSFENNPASGRHSFHLSIPYKVDKIGSLEGLSGTKRELLYWQKTYNSGCSKSLYAKTYGKEGKYTVLYKWNSQYRNKLDGLFSSNSSPQTEIDELSILFSEIPDEAPLKNLRVDIKSYISDLRLWDKKREHLLDNCRSACSENLVFETNAAKKALEAICQNCANPNISANKGIPRGLKNPPSSNLAEDRTSRQRNLPNFDSWKAKWDISKAEGLQGIESFLAMYAGSSKDSAQHYSDSALYILPMQIRIDTSNKASDSIMLLDLFFPFQQIEIFPKGALQIQTQRISSNILYQQDTAVIQWQEKLPIHLVSLIIAGTDDVPEQVFIRDKSVGSQWQPIKLTLESSASESKVVLKTWSLEEVQLDSRQKALKIDIASNFAQEDFKPSISISGEAIMIDSIRAGDSLSTVYTSLPDITWRGQNTMLSVKLNNEERTALFSLASQEYPYKNGITPSHWIVFTLPAIGAFLLILLILYLLLSRLYPLLKYWLFRRNMIFRKANAPVAQKTVFRNLNIKDNELLVNCRDYLVPYSYWKGSKDHPCRTEVCPMPVCRCNSLGANYKGNSFLSMHPVHVPGNWLWVGIAGSFLSFLLLAALQYFSTPFPKTEVELFQSFLLRISLSTGIFSALGISIKRQFYHMYSWQKIVRSIFYAIMFASLTSTCISSLNLFDAQSYLWSTISWVCWAFTGGLILSRLISRSWMTLIIYSIICGIGISFIYQLNFEIELFPWQLLAISLFSGTISSIAFLLISKKDSDPRLEINEANLRYSSLLPSLLLQKKSNSKLTIGNKDSSSEIQLGQSKKIESVCFALHKEHQSGYWIELIQGSLLIKSFTPAPGQQIKLIPNTENQAYILMNQDKISLPDKIELQYFSEKKALAFRVT